MQRAASEAVAEFQRRGSTATSGDAASTAPPPTPVLLANDNASPSGMHADLYYASLARGLLIEPQPPLTIVEGCCDDEGYGGVEMELWS
uniref:Uncharacterized protein n=1 Tax=Oryza rufipogon TaxID=4529 RepID=A0A0E0MVL5_ORYRU